MITYRADIDGMRALAVLLVLFFHAGFAQPSGGFIGVDIFFVISGYLITSIIYREMSEGKFSYARFYERRARRILPALYVMSILAMLAGLFILTPSALVKAATSALAAFLFSANIYFWRTTNYFSSDSEFEPFLHTWSLGVEEQFYFLLPLVLIPLIRHHARLKLVLGFSFLGALAISIYATQHHQWAGYYLLPSRAFELLAGSMVALYPPALPKSSISRNLLALAATLMIMLPAFLYNASTPFPGMAAVPVTLGSSLLMLLGSQPGGSIINRILSWRPLVIIGLGSYSLYLWHWPVLAYLRNYSGSVHLSPALGLAGLALSAMLTWFSWRFVETPFRDRVRFPRAQVFRYAMASSAICIAGFLALIQLDGLSQRMNPLVIQYSSLNAEYILRDNCMHLSDQDIIKGNTCLLPDNSRQPASMILWGDSHAGAMKPGYQETLENLQLRGEFIGRVGCPPLPGVLKANFKDDGLHCLSHNQAVLEHILQTPGLRTVILHARWALSAEGSRYGEEGGQPYELEARWPGSDKVRFNSNQKIVEGAFLRLLEQLTRANKDVIILGPVPETGHNIPMLMANNLLWNKNRELRPSLDAFFQRQSQTLAILATLSTTYPVTIIYPHETLCPDTDRFCRIITENNELLYLDDDHISPAGAALISQLLTAEIRPLLQPHTVTEVGRNKPAGNDG